MGNNSHDITNKVWIKGLKNDPNKFFERLFREMTPSLYRFAFTYTMNEELAKDVVQDTFMRLWTMAPSLPDNTNLPAYLYSSVKNSCLNYYKHLQVEDSNRTKLTEALIYASSLEYEDDSSLIDEVRECLQKLPNQQRKVMEMKVFQNMSYKEIAEALGLSEGSIHTHVKRAYKSIRESMSAICLFLCFKEMFFLDLFPDFLYPVFF